MAGSFDIQATFDSEELRVFLSAVAEKRGMIIGKKGKYPALVSALVYEDIIDHFKNEQGPRAGWVAWSQIYIDHLTKAGRQGNKKLQFSGKLRNTFTPAKYRPTSEGILWFNNAMTRSGFPYAQAHDEGAKRLPARPFMWLSERALDKISEQTLQFLMEEG